MRVLFLICYFIVVVILFWEWVYCNSIVCFCVLKLFNVFYFSFGRWYLRRLDPARPGGDCSGADGRLPEREQLLNDTSRLADFRRRRKQLNLLHLFVFNIVLYFKSHQFARSTYICHLISSSRTPLKHLQF